MRNVTMSKINNLLSVMILKVIKYNVLHLKF